MLQSLLLMLQSECNAGTELFVIGGATEQGQGLAKGKMN